MHLNDKIVEYLSKNGVKWVSLSLDGFDVDSNNVIRSSNKSFTEVVKAIPLLKSYGIKVRVGTVITALTNDIAKLRALGNLLERLHVDTWKLMQFFPREVGRKSGDNALLLSIPDEDFAEVESQLRAEFQGRLNIAFHTVKDFHNAPALLIQPTGTVTVTQGNQDILLGNVLYDPTNELIKSILEFNQTITLNANKTYGS